MPEQNTVLLVSKATRSFQEKVKLFLRQNIHLMNPIQLNEGIKATSDEQQIGFTLLISNKLWETNKILKEQGLSYLFADDVLIVEHVSTKTVLHPDFINNHFVLRKTATA